MADRRPEPRVPVFEKARELGVNLIGVHKGVPLGPQWALRAFMDFQIPEDLSAGYGYPQLTDQAKRKILGENLLRLHGLDVAEVKSRLGTR
jgi:hypothetical protein